MPACVITVSISVNKGRLAALDVSSGEETSITGTINCSEGYSMPRYFLDHIWEKYRMESQPSKIIQDL
jgi:hypothetical protein